MHFDLWKHYKLWVEPVSNNDIIQLKWHSFLKTQGQTESVQMIKSWYTNKYATTYLWGEPSMQTEFFYLITGTNILCQMAAITGFYMDLTNDLVNIIDQWPGGPRSYLRQPVIASPVIQQTKDGRTTDSWGGHRSILLTWTGWHKIQ